RYAGMGEIELKNWIGDAVRIRLDPARIGLLRKIDAIADHVFVRFVQKRYVARVTLRDVVRKIRLEGHGLTLAEFRHAEKRYPLRGKTTKVDGVAAAGASYCDRDVLSAGNSRFEIPLSEHAKPPTIITRAIGSGRTFVRAD